MIDKLKIIFLFALTLTLFSVFVVLWYLIPIVVRTSQMSGEQICNSLGYEVKEIDDDFFEEN